MTARYEAEIQLVSTLLTGMQCNSVEASEVLMIIDPEHIMHREARMCIEKMKKGDTIIELLSGETREFVLGIRSELHSPALSWNLYRRVKEEWIRDELMGLFSQSQHDPDSLSMLYKIQAGVQRIENGITESRRAEAAEKFGAKLESETVFIPTGIDRLDRALGGGLFPTAKVVIAARPSVGKTAFAAFISRLMVERGEQVGFWSIESPDDQIMRRVMCSKHRIIASQMNRNLGAERIAELKASALAMQARGLSIYNASGLSSQQVAAEMMSTSARVCVVDHLQKFTANKELRLVIRDASAAFSHAANKKGKAVIMISQLNRDGENTEPTMRMLNESGSIEQDADVIIFLWTSQPDTGQQELDVNVTIAKHRDGEKGFFTLKFQRQFFSFYEIDNNHKDTFF